jgi:Mg-chelatase subunit ChlD
VQNPIEEVLRPAASQYKSSVAAAILIDTSGSMNESGRYQGVRRRKIGIVVLPWIS